MSTVLGNIIVRISKDLKSDKVTNITQNFDTIQEIVESETNTDLSFISMRIDHIIYIQYPL